MRAHKLDLRPRRQIEQQRNFLAIKFLRKSHDWLGIPRRAIRRSEDADIDRFLLDDVRDRERQQKNPPLRPTHVDRRTVALGVDHRSFRNEKGFHHNAEILAERPRSVPHAAWLRSISVNLPKLATALQPARTLPPSIAGPGQCR